MHTLFFSITLHRPSPLPQHSTTAASLPPPSIILIDWPSQIFLSTNPSDQNNYRRTLHGGSTKSCVGKGGLTLERLDEDGWFVWFFVCCSIVFDPAICKCSPFFELGEKNKVILEEETMIREILEIFLWTWKRERERERDLCRRRIQRCRRTKKGLFDWVKWRVGI